MLYMIIRVITWIIAVWVISSLLNRYIFPVFRTTANTTDQLRDMQKQLHEMNKKLSKQQQQKPSMFRKKKEGDYIDYEDVG